ncbi:MAG: discoidin domain-containing protein, partial [Planctomycetes bacterium]|nr:discoidin domain-containing protein [Planctomycetota bacterium]
ADIESDLDSCPPARQLRASLLSYAAGELFQPRTRVEIPQVRALFRDLTLTEKLGARVIRATSAQSGYGAALMLDGDASTMWHTVWGEGAPGFPHEVVIGFDRSAKLGGVLLLPRQDGNRNGWIRDCEIYVSEDGEEWGAPVSKVRLSRDAPEKEIRFSTPAAGRFLKLVALAPFDDQPFASLAELSVLSPEPERS